MKSGRGDPALPALQQIEADAMFGVTTTSMRVAWQIAAEMRLLDAQTCMGLIEAQANLIDRELAAASATPDARETLIQMRGEYRQLLSGPPVLSPGFVRRDAGQRADGGC